MKTVIVTRHKALLEYIVMHRLAPDDAVILTHVDAEAIRGKHVIGVLPLHLAAEAAKVTEIPMNIPSELRGQELTLEQMDVVAGMPVTYIVRTEYAYEADLRDARLGG